MLLVVLDLARLILGDESTDMSQSVSRIEMVGPISNMKYGTPRGTVRSTLCPSS